MDASSISILAAERAFADWRLAFQVDPRLLGILSGHRAAARLCSARKRASAIGYAAINAALGGR